jgi:hypothetical protein
MVSFRSRRLITRSNLLITPMEHTMWLISLILIPLLTLAAALTTLLVIVVLKGYPSLPDSMTILYLLSACSLVPTLGLLAGFLTGVAALTLLPFKLLALTSVLLSASKLL